MKLTLNARQIFFTLFDIIHQTNVANGISTDNGMLQWIVNMRKESNRCHDLIDDLMLDPSTTISDITTIVPNWPVYVEVE